MVVSMERWKGKVAIVTGANSGIGKAIAIQLVEAGLLVVGLARRKDKLDELGNTLKGKPGKFYAIQADISKEDDILQAFKWVKDNLGPVHILVNSAGIYRITSLLDGETKYYKEVMDVNVLALCITTREAIKDMRSNNVDGHIIHINSIGGHKIIDSTANVCGASKFAVTALTETLRQELNSVGSKIKVTSVSPGKTDTNIFETTAKDSGIPMSKEFADFIEHTPSLNASDLADAVTYVLSTPPHVQVHELIIKPVGERM